ncbi:hypothetical protein DP129_10940 [Clostridium tetani]|uniref:DUF2577 domain-containing protein n=1 Tax=Clostridium tetani TaxID=1513 RepID=UPI00100AE442|nr:DUF2577 domain-containing protein [Clostridium tetani]RXI38727.1 hypothetical protein DP129_10940 [Clostridium tetani]
MGMIEISKKAAIDAINTSKPVNVLYGEIMEISTNTLEKNYGEIHYFKAYIDKIKIKVDQKQILDKDFFIIPESLPRYEVDLKHSHGSTGTALGKLVIREGLKKGDKVLLLRVQGGQQYVILDRVV